MVGHQAHQQLKRHQIYTQLNLMAILIQLKQ